VTNPYPPIEVLTDDQVEAIHSASLTLLQHTGMRVLHGPARRLLAHAGADVDDDEQMVRLDKEMVEEYVAIAHHCFNLRARNPEHDLVIGGRGVVFSSVSGPAYCHDLDRGRRPGTYQEMCDYLRLVQALNIVHQEGGGPFEPLDLPKETSPEPSFSAR
jgi:trimethylamine--corrinoid protein Co-methyltransferase